MEAEAKATPTQANPRTATTAAPAAAAGAIATTAPPKAANAATAPRTTQRQQQQWNNRKQQLLPQLARTSTQKEDFGRIKNRWQPTEATTRYVLTNHRQAPWPLRFVESVTSGCIENSGQEIRTQGQYKSEVGG